jgi:hypothetical protein
MRRLTQLVLMGVGVLGVATLAAAQETRPPGGTMTPVMRLGNFLEVGNDVFMKIIATGEIRYNTVENNDFDNRVRDRAHSRNPDNNTLFDAEGDVMNAQLQLGVDARYQKNLQLYLLFRHHAAFDGNTIDDRANCTNPGGTDVFGRPASTENPGFRAERYWIDYKFEGTPLRVRVGADLWNVDQAGIVGDDDPRFAVFGEFGDFDVMAAAVIQYESARIGLENDNDNIYYTFSAGYNLKPHRFQLDAVYMRDRFAGADLGGATRTTGSGIGFQGQTNDSVLVMVSWSGQLGPVRALIQANGIAGRAHGGTVGIPAGVAPDRAYDILAGAGIAYVEADLGIVRPYAGIIIGTADGDPTDRKLRGFSNLAWQDVGQVTGTTWFAHLDRSPAFAHRDYACPARLGTPVAGSATTAGVVGPTPLRPAVPGAVTTPLNIGVNVLGTTGGGAECTHSVTNPFNQSLGVTSHLGISTTYSNPGTLVVPAGVKLFPLKGHEITGWYVYRAMLHSGLLETAFAPQLGGSKIDKAMYHEVGGYWQWTLNPNFDFRLAGSAAVAGDGWREVAHLADCDTSPGVSRCTSKNVALKGEARFRARF